MARAMPTFAIWQDAGRALEELGWEKNDREWPRFIEKRNRQAGRTGIGLQVSRFQGGGASAAAPSPGLGGLFAKLFCSARRGRDGFWVWIPLYHHESSR
jgi:hypothetical protein